MKFFRQANGRFDRTFVKEVAQKLPDSGAFERKVGLLLLPNSAVRYAAGETVDQHAYGSLRYLRQSHSEQIESD